MIFINWKRTIIFGIILLVVIEVYFLCSFPYLPTPNSGLNFYSLLVDSLFHGKLDVIAKAHFNSDLSLYKGKYYLYWGPAPVFFVLPFYLFGGKEVNDVIYTVISGIINVILFYFVLKEFNKTFKIASTLFSEVILVLYFAFITPNLFLSSFGRIWATNQVIATNYLLLFLLFYCMYLRKKRIKYFVFSALFFNLVWLSRFSLIFYGLLFFYPLIVFGKKQALKLLVPLFSLSLMFIVGFFIYNYVRFDTILEVGHRFQQGNKQFTEYMKTNTLISFHYLPYNIYHYFFRSPFKLSFPFFFYDDGNGNSIFIFYSYILFFPMFFFQKYKENSNLFINLSFTIVFAILLFLLFLPFAAEGTQTGVRYFFDVIPLLLLLLSFLISKIPRYLIIGVGIFGILVNIIAILNVYGVIQ